MSSSVRLALRLAFAIAASGVFWVAVSNDFLSGIAPDKAVLVRYHVYAEWLYVLAVAALVYFLAQRIFDRLAAAEWKLSESEGHFRQFVEHAPVALAMLDREMRYLIVNNRWKEVAGLDDERFTGRLHYEVFPELPKRWKELHRRGLEGEVLRFDEDKMVRKDGSVIWVRRGIRPWHASDGSIGGIVIFVEDVTAHKQADDALSASERNYRLLFEDSRDALLLCAPPTWKFSTANRAALQIFGIVSEEELVDLAPWDISPEYQPDGMSSSEKARQMVEIALREETNSFEWTFKRRDGTNFAAEVLLTRMELNGSIFILSSVHDVSKRKKLEKDLMERRKEMEKLQKFQVIAQTVSAMAHELNQPLAAISAYSQAALLLLDSKNSTPSAELRIAVQRAAEQALRAGQSLRDMLHTLYAGEFATEAFDLNQEIREALAMVRAEHELQFRSCLEMDERLPQVQANRTHVQKAFLNLLHNSIEAMRLASVPEPELTVTVCTRPDESAAQVTVRDNGPGIEEEVAHHLFQPFFTSKPSGIGMGLVISRSLIEANGGQLWLDPHEKSGATFHLMIPLAP